VAVAIASQYFSPSLIAQLKMDWVDWFCRETMDLVVSNIFSHNQGMLITTFGLTSIRFFGIFSKLSAKTIIPPC